MDIYHRLGRVIRELREKAGHSQEAFAALAGVHRTYMTKIEQGKAKVSVQMLENIAKALKLEPWELLHRLSKKHD